MDGGGVHDAYVTTGNLTLSDWNWDYPCCAYHACSSITEVGISMSTSQSVK